ncbi:jg5103 [Pararge aegeria aegeria]|uniref:Jg5103 protein n=3 Tax=Pararge aegeria TaxID=116150 RepID=A0A8S4SB20_9NEOP|nr:jg5103 [Pararge aegeria aegeria]
MFKREIGSSNMDLRLHSHEFIAKFIDAFRKNPCLWNTMNPEYRNKKSRMKAYNKLLKYARSVDPKITVTDVRKKLQSIRASHRKERKKVTESMKTVESLKNVYVPKLWYYKELEFLNYNMEGTFEMTNVDNICEKSSSDVLEMSNNSSEMSITDSTSEKSFPIVQGLQIKKYVSDSDDHDTTKDEGSVKSIVSNFSLDSVRETWESDPVSVPNTIPMRANPNQPYSEGVLNNEPTNEILSYIARKIERNRDEFDIFGKNVAAELRTMTHQQRIIAKKLMNDVIFHGQLQNLTVESQVQTNNFFSES